MARVPVRRNFEVLPGGAQGARVPVSGPRGNAAAEQASQLGEAVYGAGNRLGEHVQQQQDRINQARVREGALQFREALQEAENEYSQLKGAELVSGDRPALREIEAKLEKRRGEILNGMSSDDAKYAFDQASAEQFSSYRARASKYEAEQAEFYVNQQRDAVIVANMETSLSDPARRKESLASANSTLREKFMDEGYSGDRLQQVTEDAMSEFAVSNIEALIEAGETEDAAAYLKASRDYLSGSAGKAARTMVDEAVNVRKTLGYADKVFERFDPAEFGRNAPKAQMDAYARELVGDDPEDLKALRAEIAYRTGQYEDQADDAYAQDFDEAYEVAMSQPGRLNGLPAFRRLDAKDRDALLQEVKRRSDGETRVTDLVAYTELGDIRRDEGPRAAMKYLRENASRFSTSDYKTKLNAINSDLSSGSEGESIRSVSNAIDFAIGRNGVTDKKAKGEIWKALDQWDRQMRASGKEPTEQELNEEAERLAVRVKLRKPGTAFLWIGNDTTKAMGQFGEIGNVPADRSQAVLRGLDIEAGDKPTEVQVSTVEAAYSQAMAYLRLQGVSSPSDDLLTRVIREKPWLSGNGADQ